FFAYLFLVFVLFSSTATAGNINLGALVCSKNGDGVSFLLYSSHDVECTYHGVGGPQNYTGKSGILIGVDLEGRAQDRMIYTVMGGAWSSADQLAGFYTGGKVSAAVGLGPAVQVMIATGSGVSLVPLALGGSNGLGVAAGVSYMTLSLAEPGTASTIPLPDKLKMKAAAPKEAAPMEAAPKKSATKKSAPKEEDLPREEQTTDKNAMEDLPGKQTVKPEDLDTLVEKKIIVEKKPAIAKTAKTPQPKIDVVKTADKPVSEEQFIEKMKNSNKPLEDGIIREWNKRRQAG
ncbi:MAG: DUF992 domain-containing protein, partial [Rhodospirillales bacterium]|nr:DUF992 domain-containing protein [Rhodospirillales bacterium]